MSTLQGIDRVEDDPHPITGTAAPLVWKFGGTSVADHARLRAVAERMVAAQRAGRGVVAVLSAMGTSTDELSALAYAMSSRPPLRELDALLAVGESISCALASMAVAELGSHAVSLTGPQAGILTDDRHGNARLREIRPRRITDALDQGAIVLVTGFQGVSGSGDLTTLGRGGSDASAVAVAAALGVTECEIFTDVPAVFTADPRVVPGARRLASLRHEEMLEMAEAGAGVLQPRSVELAVAHGVDIHLRSSFSTGEGTWIRRERAVFEESETSGVAGIAHRRHESLYTVRDVPVAAVATALAERGLTLGAAVPGEGALRFSAPGAEPAEVAAALGGAAVHVSEDLGTVSVVSLGIARRPDIVVRALAALDEAGIAPRLVTTTPGRLTVHVESAVVDDAVRLLHGVFIPAVGAGDTDLEGSADAA
ncbi:aspartate kinase [Pseudonocardia bannensis]|uniref:Aspartokinase n=1 Tax=Pseudonocardia bannensis TaxID=630973 RepID=A0A848DS04_9PSEU|nr:aspartate kinase [Pseudonocardia bannensis]NMH95295.1 aspartate kinase [Pseudonocardia bannensis]